MPVPATCHESTAIGASRKTPRRGRRALDGVMRERKWLWNSGALTSLMIEAREAPESRLSLAFPFRVQRQARLSLRQLPRAELGPHGLVPLSNVHRYSPPRLQDTRLLIPYRIYNPPVRGSDVPVSDLPFVAAIYTRHYDGHVRQSSMRLALESWQPWMSPFVVQLLGEYVVEIGVEIREWLATVGDSAKGHLYAFTASNPEFTAITRARATSYWNEYYRGDFLLRSYPPLEALREIVGASR